MGVEVRDIFFGVLNEKETGVLCVLCVFIAHIINSFVERERRGLCEGGGPIFPFRVEFVNTAF